MTRSSEPPVFSYGGFLPVDELLLIQCVQNVHLFPFVLGRLQAEDDFLQGDRVGEEIFLNKLLGGKLIDANGFLLLLQFGQQIPQSDLEQQVLSGWSRAFS